MQKFAESFYYSPAWKSARVAYAKSKGGLCERCLARGVYRAGEIVHHKIHLTPTNIYDPSITLNWSNLQLLCRDCHAAVHKPGRRYKVDKIGRVTARE